jgi:hypothetical protein
MAVRESKHSAVFQGSFLLVTNDGKYTAKEYLVEVGNPVPLRRLMPSMRRPVSVKYVFLSFLSDKDVFVLLFLPVSSCP